MKKIEKKTKFQTEDGQTFEDEEAAKKHEALIVAKREYEGRRSVFASMLAQTFETADGHPFEFGLFHDYYFIVKMHDSLPRLRKVSFWGRNWDMKGDDGEDDRLVLISFEDPWGRATKEGIQYPIDELYRDEENAKIALKAVQFEWLENMKKLIEEYSNP